MTQPTVYIIDDEYEVTDSLRWLIESVNYQVLIYHDALSFLADTASLYIKTPSCLVLDIRMPDMSGLELQEALQEKNIQIPIIFITGHGDIAMAVRAMKAGAFDFLTKPVNNQVLLEAINKAIKISIRQQQASEQNSQILARAQQLTPRELEVMKLMVQGKHTKVIATELMISPNTVELHRAKVIKKMGVRSAGELINLVLTSKALNDVV